MSQPAQLFHAGPSPHIRQPESTRRIMLWVIVALLPAALYGVYLFGANAALVLVLCTGFAVVLEALWQRMIGRPMVVGDGSAALTGLLLALNLPPNAPWWMCLIGAAVAVIVAKGVFGGLGQNVFNPALVARVFLLISFPVQMTDYAPPAAPFGTGAAVDAASYATPLAAMKEQLLTSGVLGPLEHGFTRLSGITGNMGGSLGEMSFLLLLLGGAFLLVRRVITWQIPASFIGTVVALTGLMHVIDPARYADPLFHLVTGGLMLGAFFMATDYVTSPMTAKGQLIFGVLCGLLTVVIRLWGGYPEGVSFAILLGNAAVPLIDRYTMPKVFGSTRGKPAKEARA
ncbi:MAG: RnfABCDGE type electron transport complex subunit D [Candidatus Alcyoniella australis]|nr:RnfABCDGE type electron transport complex subunit D [Candidatus Alcyoniella australis]